MTTVEYELEQRATFDTLDCYVLSEVSDSREIRVYKCEDDWELAVIEIGENAPPVEVDTTLECWRYVGADPMDDEVVDREDGTLACRILARRR